MAERRLLLRGGLTAGLLLLAVIAACQRHAPAGDPATNRPPGETPQLQRARGVLVAVGNEPGSTLLLIPATGAADGKAVAIVGANVDVLQRLTGLEIEVQGERVPDRVLPGAAPGTMVLDVRAFAVRAANGVVAYDGIVGVQDGRFYLQLADGERLTVAAMPPALRDRVGARVFLVGPLDRAPIGYGIISDRP
jgi:hypothetical protein